MAATQQIKNYFLPLDNLDKVVGLLAKLLGLKGLEIHCQHLKLNLMMEKTLELALLLDLNQESTLELGQKMGVDNYVDSSI